jgi:hypothetical protein
MEGAAEYIRGPFAVQEVDASRGISDFVNMGNLNKHLNFLREK